MPFQDITTPAVLPVFVLEKWTPDGSTVYDICLAAEKVTGPGSIDGATCIKGLWRVYPMNEVARVKLLTKGITMANKLVRFEGINPFRRGDGDEKSGTRLTISNLPFSYSNEAVARNLTALGLKLRSKISFEKARGPDRMLTDWRTGRRSVWIDLPQAEVSRYCKMGDFSALLFYKEMKASVECRRCFQKGHMARDCPNEELCLDCKKPGHRRGHPDCDASHDQDIWGHHSENAGSDAEEYVWGNPKDDTGSEISANESENSDGVSDDALENNSDEDQEKEEEQIEVIEVREEHSRAQVMNRAEAGKDVSHNKAPETEVSSISTGESDDKTGTVSDKLAGSDRSDEREISKEKTISNDKLNEQGEASISQPDTCAETPKTKSKKKKKNQKVNKKHQPSIDKFLAGKRQICDVSSPGDEKSGSPDEKSLKTTS